MKETTSYCTHPFFKVSREERITNGRKGAYVAGYKPYSDSDDAYLIENYQKIPLTHIAKTLNRSKKSVFTRSKKLLRDGLIVDNKSWEKSHYSKKEDRFIIANQDKMSFAEVAQVLGRSRDSVKVRAGKLGVSFRKIAETAPTVKLSNEDIELIRELAEAGLNFCEIARKFEVDNSHVRNVCQFHSRLYLDKTDYISHKKRQADAIDGMG